MEPPDQLAPPKYCCDKPNLSPEPRRVMIDPTYLKARRTETSLRSKTGGQTTMGQSDGSNQGRHEHQTACLYRRRGSPDPVRQDRRRGQRLHGCGRGTTWVLMRQKPSRIVCDQRLSWRSCDWLPGPAAAINWQDKHRRTGRPCRRVPRCGGGEWVMGYNATTAGHQSPKALICFGWFGLLNVPHITLTY